MHGSRRLHGSLMLSLLLSANALSGMLMFDAMTRTANSDSSVDIVALPVFVPLLATIAIGVYFFFGREECYRTAEEQFSKEHSSNWSAETTAMWTYVAATIVILAASVIVAV